MGFTYFYLYLSVWGRAVVDEQRRQRREKFPLAVSEDRPPCLADAGEGEGVPEGRPQAHQDEPGCRFGEARPVPSARGSFLSRRIFLFPPPTTAWTPATGATTTTSSSLTGGTSIPSAAADLLLKPSVSPPSPAYEEKVNIFCGVSGSKFPIPGRGARQSGRT